MIHVVLASDRNLVRQAGIAALSARRQTAAPLRVTFLTPAQDASSGLWDTVTRALAAERTECEVRPVQIALPELQLAAHLTPVTYYRLLLPRLLPERDERVIYLDCDVLVNTDLESYGRMNSGIDPSPVFPIRSSRNGRVLVSTRPTAISTPASCCSTWRRFGGNDCSRRPCVFRKSIRRR